MESISYSCTSAGRVLETCRTRGREQRRRELGERRAVPCYHDLSSNLKITIQAWIKHRYITDHTTTRPGRPQTRRHVLDPRRRPDPTASIAVVFYYFIHVGRSNTRFYDSTRANGPDMSLGATPEPQGARNCGRTEGLRPWTEGLRITAWTGSAGARRISLWRTAMQKRQRLSQKDLEKRSFDSEAQ